MQTIEPTVYFEKFLASLDSSEVAKSLWTSAVPWSTLDWTIEMTRVLVKTTQSALGPEIQVCAKDHPDKYRRSEYLGLDVTAYDDQGWGPPRIIVEHENLPFEYKIQYCAWKLLCVRADLRVLVAYLDSTSHYSKCFSSRDAMLKSIRQVRECFDGPLSVISGEWCGPILAGGWRDIFRMDTL